MNAVILDVTELSTWQQAVFVLVGLTIWLLVTALTIFALIRSANMPPPMLLVISLTSVVLISIAAFVITGREDLSTLAGLGLGALAGAVSATWAYPGHKVHDGKDEGKEEDPPNPHL